MKRLIIVTVIWALSFSLIGNYIAGKMDTYMAILLRLLIALFFFLPLIQFKTLFSKNSLKIMGVGALQIGLMYILYFKSFSYLAVVEVALFTVLTPLYVSVVGSLLDKEFKIKQLFHVLIVIAGAVIIKWSSLSSEFVRGFLLVQGANLSFSLGQVIYKRFLPESNQRESFGLFYLGALLPILPMVLLFSNTDLSLITNLQWTVLLWLGAIASGLGYFLWNSGAKLVSYGELAVMNNAVIPLAIFVNIVFWNKSVNWPLFLPGCLIVLTGIFLEVRSKKV